MQRHVVQVSVRDQEHARARWNQVAELADQLLQHRIVLACSDELDLALPDVGCAASLQRLRAARDVPHDDVVGADDIGSDAVRRRYQVD